MDVDARLTTKIEVLFVKWYIYMDYRIQRGFLLLFIFLSYPSYRAFQGMPSSRVFRPSLHLASRSILRFHSLGYAIELRHNPNTESAASPKSRIQDPSEHSNRASSSLSPSPVAPDGECPRASSVLPTSLVMESNRHHGAVRCCVQRTVHLDLVTEVPRAQCLRFEEELRPPNASTILGWFCSICLSSIARLRG